ncbi:hypothetical protein ACFLZG_05580, partial [Thermodesulfobacteriota bacterium]
MKNIESRVTRLEDQMKKIIEQSKLDIKELWTKLDTAELNKIKNAVEIFRENFGGRQIQYDSAIIRNGISPE